MVMHLSLKLKPGTWCPGSAASGGSTGAGKPALAARVRWISVTPWPYCMPAMEHLKKSIWLQVRVPAGRAGQDMQTGCLSCKAMCHPPLVMQLTPC